MTDPEPDSKRRSISARYRYKPMGVAYQGAMESVLAIAVATALGYWADQRFDTSPWLLATGATIGFAAFVLRLTRLGVALNQAASAQEPSDQDSNESRPTKSGTTRD